MTGLLWARPTRSVSSGHHARNRHLDALDHTDGITHVRLDGDPAAIALLTVLAEGSAHREPSDGQLVISTDTARDLGPLLARIADRSPLEHGITVLIDHRSAA